MGDHEDDDREAAEDRDDERDAKGKRHGKHRGVTIAIMIGERRPKRQMRGRR